MGQRTFKMMMRLSIGKFLLQYLFDSCLTYDEPGWRVHGRGRLHATIVCPRFNVLLWDTNLTIASICDPPSSKLLHAWAGKDIEPNQARFGRRNEN